MKTNHEQSAAEPRIAWRYWSKARPMFYVSQLPTGGSDWGYTDKPEGAGPDKLDKAIPLSPYWQKRFAADCRRAGTEARFVPVSPPPEKTKVIFRVFRDDKDVSNPLAVFPEVPSDVAGNFCESYQPVGQHSACDPCIGSRGDTRAATPEEYAALKRELEGKGYVLDVRRKVTDAMHVARRKAAAR